MKLFTPIIAFLLLLPHLAHCQSRSSLDLIMGYDYSYRTLRSSSGDQDQIIPVFMELRQEETGKVNFRLGVDYNLRLTKQVHLKSGIRLAPVAYKGKKLSGIQWGSELESGHFDPTLPHEIQFIYEYRYVEIPVVARYEFGVRSLTPFVELGVSPSVYLTTRTITRTDIYSKSEQQRNEADYFNNFQLVGNLSFGLNYTLNPSFTAFAQPVFRYHFTQLMDAPIEEHLYSVGLEFGVRRRFKA